MDSRKRVIAAGRQSPVVAILRRRRGKPVAPEGREGRVIPFSEKEVVTKLLRKVPGMVNVFRDATYLHVSTLLGSCVRKIALSHKYNISMPSELISDSLGITFAQGRVIDTYLKDLVSKGYPAMAFGVWSCLCGATKTEPIVKRDIPPISCQKCSMVPSVYTEMLLVDDEHMVTGSPDIVLYFEAEGFYYPVEVKSMAHERWKELVRPLPDHVLQVTFYWHFLRTNGYNVPSQVSIVYVSKGFNFKTPYKEFEVYPADEVYRLAPYLLEAKALKESRSGTGPLPIRVVCSSEDCASAKECHVSSLCFTVD